MKEDYQAYRKLSKKEKEKRIDNAVQDEKYRGPNPQGVHEFHQYSFIDFQVEDEGKMIKLETYRHNVAEGKEVKGVIFMFHGLNSHVGHGAHMAEYFSQNGLITVGFDHRGFGRSEGRGGYVQSLESHLQDSKKFLDLVMPMFENLPKFVLGLSMGGMTSYHLTLENPKLFDGAILMAPALKNNVSGVLVSVTKTIAKLLPQKMKLTKPIYGKASKNPVITQFVKNDPYAFSDRVSLATVKMLVHTMDKSPDTFKNYKCPFMIVQGGLDKLVNPEVAFQLYDNSMTPVQDKELVFYEDLWHDIWHEPEIHEIMERIAVWIHKRITKKQMSQ